jgi:hypothetical protein
MQKLQNKQSEKRFNEGREVEAILDEYVGKREISNELWDELYKVVKWMRGKYRIESKKKTGGCCGKCR